MQGWEASSRSCEKAGAKLGFQESQALIRLKQERRGWNGRWQSRFKMSGMLGRLEVISEKLTSKIPNYRSCARRRKMQEDPNRGRQSGRGLKLNRHEERTRLHASRRSAWNASNVAEGGGRVSAPIVDQKVLAGRSFFLLRAGSGIWRRARGKARTRLVL